MEETQFISALKEKYPHRNQEIQTLANMIGVQPSPHLFVYGQTSTGKTSIVREMVQQYVPNHAFVDAVECFSIRVLYENVLNQLARHTPSPLNDYSNYCFCNKSSDFLAHVKRITNPDEYYCIVIDKAEFLREIEGSVILFLLTIEQLTDRFISVIFISEVVWEKYRQGTGSPEPIPIPFLDYSQDQLDDIIMLHCPSTFERPLYKQLLKIVSSVFYKSSRDFNEVRYIMNQLYPIYAKPIQEGTINKNDARALFSYINPYLKKFLEKVYQRDVSTADWEKQDAKKTPGKPSAQRTSELNLPEYTKFLLIAAYLASYNPPKYDVRFFTSTATSRKRLRLTEVENKNILAGPQSFPIDRLLAIFYSIMDHPVDSASEIYTQVSTLVSLNLLTQVSKPENLSVVKYKCNVSQSFIQLVSRDVSFDLGKYLLN